MYLTSRQVRKAILTLGVVGNLALLGYFKYAYFSVQVLNSIIGTDLTLHRIILPIGISFFTFQQIACIVDTFRGKVKLVPFLEYCLFVVFFPQLIAGPIVYHREILPQLNKLDCRFRHKNLVAGGTIFLLGLTKKVLLADSISNLVEKTFDQAALGIPITFLVAWGGTLAYAIQLYFDFSGYSDMAIGLGRMFGLRLPQNFNSPYKASSIIEFWRRWHITLSHFLREYVYFTLGGSRLGKVRRYVNLMITMLLGGLWHGAGWTFIFWGGLHGTYLLLNHAWLAAKNYLGFSSHTRRPWEKYLGVGVTFFAVLVGWIFFRADSLDAAFVVLRGMAGANGITLRLTWVEPFHWLNLALHSMGITFGNIPFGRLDFLWLLALLGIIWFAPNTQQWMQNEQPVPGEVPYSGKLQWRPTITNGMALGILSFLIFKKYFVAQPSEFLYYQF